jgi:hypothetical protein
MEMRYKYNLGDNNAMNLARYFLFSASLLLLASSCSRTILEISTLEDDKEYYNGNEV